MSAGADVCKKTRTYPDRQDQTEISQLKQTLSQGMVRLTLFLGHETTRYPSDAIAHG
jgi:hypothetical protein